MVLHVYYGSEDTDGYASLPLLLSGSDSETEHEAGTDDDTEREAGTDDGSTDDETDNESATDYCKPSTRARACVCVRPRARVCRIKQRRSSATAHLHPRLGHSVDVQFRRGAARSQVSGLCSQVPGFNTKTLPSWSVDYAAGDVASSSLRHFRHGRWVMQLAM